MRILPFLALAFSISSALLGAAVLAPQGLSQEKTTAFTGEPPVFVNAGTPNYYINRLLAAYYFTIKLPPKSDQSLSQVTIQQQVSPETIQFNLDQTQAFQDSRGQKKTLTLKNVSLDTNTQTIAIEFDPPISPGTTFTIVLEAQRNPFIEGVYLFNIAALPAGSNPTPLTLGTARFHFYSVF